MPLLVRTRISSLFFLDFPKELARCQSALFVQSWESPLALKHQWQERILSSLYTYYSFFFHIFA